MPIRARSLGRSVLGSPTETPSTLIRPSWNGSSPLTHLISVDLPEPEGPHTTTTSPLLTSVLHSLRTWNSPYHLLIFLIEIMTQVSFGARERPSRRQNRLQNRQLQRIAAIRPECRRDSPYCRRRQKTLPSQ